MAAWRKGIQFIDLLERKQNAMLRQCAIHQDALRSLGEKGDALQQQWERLRQEIRDLLQTGTLTQAGLRECLRQQGILLSQQHTLWQQIQDIKEARELHQQQLLECQEQTAVLHKRKLKIQRFFTQLRLEHIRRQENMIENDIQEIASYGRENYCQ
ncbi:hypothetical protein [Enterobacter sp. 22466]|uniref:hypothetical protein n=1 Tax=Enterobacter sp. 22466 TaxID=3453924 RepID=UPI003F83B18E